MKKLSDCRVLLVDDAKAYLDILVEGLKPDHKLSLAPNGEIALQIAARTPPDLVLLDIMMPGLDGRPPGLNATLAFVDFEARSPRSIAFGVAKTATFFLPYSCR